MVMFAFQIEIFDSEEQKLEYIHGIVAADTFSNAVNKLANYYGEDNLLCIHELYSVDDLIEMPKEVYYNLEL